MSNIDKKHRISFIGIVVIVVFVTGLVAVKFIFFPIKNKEQPSQINRKNPAPVRVQVIETEPFSIFMDFSGTISANKDIEISSEKSGKIAEVFFKDGENVEEGKLLLKINDAVLQAQLNKLLVNESFLSQTETRKKNLFKLNSISQQEYENSLAELNNLRAEIDLVKSQIQETEIRAPFSGKLGISSIAKGSYISAGTPIVRLQQNEYVNIDFFIPENLAHELKIGDSIYFEVAQNKNKYNATIIAINSKIESDTRQLMIRASSKNSKNDLIPGSDVLVSIKMTAKNGAILIPGESIVSSANGKKIFILKNGKAEEVFIECGVRKNDKIEIIKGLHPGDTLITSGIMQLKKGKEVLIKSKP